MVDHTSLENWQAKASRVRISPFPHVTNFCRETMDTERNHIDHNLPPPESLVDKLSSVPPMLLDRNAPPLNATEANTLQEQWNLFWSIRHNEGKSNDQLDVSPTLQATRLLSNNSLLHHMRFDAQKVHQILHSGIISGEIGFDQKIPTSEDGETHYCADFFVHYSVETIGVYIQRAQVAKMGNGSIRKRPMESYNCPNSSNECIAFVIGGNQPLLTGLLTHSGTGLETSNLKGFNVSFPYGSDMPAEAARHLAVLVGIPSNLISTIVVGGKLARNQERMNGLKESILNAGLEIAICDHEGKSV